MRRQPASKSASSRSRPASPASDVAHLVRVEALEHAVDQDPEALVDRRLLGDREDARELVLQRARPVEVDVRRREPEAAAAARDERLQRRLLARRDEVAAARALGLALEQVAVERRGLERGALLGGRGLGDELVDGLDRVLDPLLGGALEERRELDQLEEARHRLVDVVGDVESHLAERAPRPPRRLEHVVADHPVGGVQALGGAEELLLVDLLVAAKLGAHRLVHARRPHRLPVAGLGMREDERAAGACHREVGEPRGLGDRVVARRPAWRAAPRGSSRRAPGARRAHRGAGRAGRDGRTRGP